jgi:hypothetical protein
MINFRHPILTAPDASSDVVFQPRDLTVKRSRILAHLCLVAFAITRPSVRPNVATEPELHLPESFEDQTSDPAPSMLDLTQSTFFCESALARAEDHVIDHFSEDDVSITKYIFILIVLIPCDPPLMNSTPANALLPHASCHMRPSVIASAISLAVMFVM